MVAAYEGARAATRGTSTNDEVITKCGAILSGRRIQGAVVNVSPANIQKATSGTEIRIQISIPWASNTPTRAVLSGQSNLTVEAVMLRE